MNGYYDALIYVILGSIAFVFLDDLCAQIAPATALFFMSGIAILCFNLLSYRSLNQVYRSIFSHPLLFLLMSTALGIDWFCMVYATYYSDPFITMTAIFVSSALLGFFALYKQSGATSYLLSMALLLATLLVLYFKYQIQNSGDVGFGILLGVGAGISFYVYMVTSNNLCQRSGLSAVQILATRFWVLFLGSALVLHSHDLHMAWQNNALSLTLVSIGSLVIPVFFNQQAINKLGAALVSVIISLVPITTYLIYAIWHNNFIMTNTVLGIMITSAIIIPKCFKTKIPESKIGILRNPH